MVQPAATSGVMADPRDTDLIARVTADLARARAAARARLTAAVERLRAAERRLAQTRSAGEQVPARAATVRDTRLSQAAERYVRAAAELTGRAATAARDAAPGAASAAWWGWQPSPAGRAEPPGALRVGEIRVEVAPTSATPRDASTRLAVGPAPAAPAPLSTGSPPLPTNDPVPALVRLLDRAHLVVRGPDRTAGDGVVSAALLRALGRTEPGTIRIIGYDPEQLGGALAGFAPLAPAGLLTFVGPGGLARLLDGLVDEIRRINETVLAGRYGSLRELVEAEGRRPEPWRVAVLLGNDRDALTQHEGAQLERVLRAGVACGVHVIMRGIPLPSTVDRSTVEIVTVGVPASISGCGSLPVYLDPPPPADLVTRVCQTIAEFMAIGPSPAVFADLLPPPDEVWTHSSVTELTAPLGEGIDGRLVEVTLADYPPHALIGGPSGTGKTNLIYAWMGALAARYPPGELEFYLLDFKEGVSFARFAPGRRDPSWLPHVRLAGVNVNTDREFGLALLRFLGAELRRRADAAKRHEVTKLAELRADDPGGHWPRIVAVIDEFQVLLAGSDPLATEAANLLEDLARRGRSQGIHLILASQDVRGIQALWGRHALVAQFTLRIALPKARRILAENNVAAELLPRHHAVVNADSGALEANRIVRVPAASDRENWADLQQKLWRMRPAGLAPPRLFDGDALPTLADAQDFHALSTKDSVGERGPVALLGETIDVQARSARMWLPRVPGRNLAVLGTRIDEACAVLGTAARSLAREYGPGQARFSIACLDPDARGAAQALLAELPADTGWYDVQSLPDLLAEVATGLADAAGPWDVPHFLVLYAVDAASARLALKTQLAGKPIGPSGHDFLRRILHNGPERHTHVLGWWRGVARLRDDLGGPVAARYDSIGAWVALDVHGSELTQFYPGSGGPPWYPRPWRALFFDRAIHRTAEVIIPYGLP
jgi:hypothetical protein